MITAAAVRAEGDSLLADDILNGLSSRDDGGASVATPHSDFEGSGLSSDGSGGDEDTPQGREFMALKPWLGSIWPPTNYCKDVKLKPRSHIFDENNNNWSAPDVKIDLDYVFGFSGNEGRNNAQWYDKDTIVYTAAALCIVHHIAIDDQDFYFGHDDEVKCIALHNPRGIACSGSVGANATCRLCIWDTLTQKTRHTITGFHKFAVVACSFNESGSVVASIGLDEHHSIALHSVETGLLIACCAVDKNRVLGVAFSLSGGVNHDACLCTYGVRHVCFWTPANAAAASTTIAPPGATPGCEAATPFPKGYFDVAPEPLDQRLLWQRGTKCDIIDEAVFHCCSFSPKLTLVGAHNGTVFAFDSVSFVCVQAITLGRQARQIYSITPTNVENTTFAVGLWEGSVHFVDVASSATGEHSITPSKTFLTADGQTSVQINALDEATDNDDDVLVNSVRSLDFNFDVGTLLVGTVINHIYDVDVRASATGAIKSRTVVGSHWGNLRSASQSGEIWGVDAHPTQPIAYSCSYDGTVRMWNLDDNKELARHHVATCATVLNVSLDTSLCAVGMINGSFCILDAALTTIVVPPIRDRRRRVNVIRFSPNGQYLAVGAENAVDVYEVVAVAAKSTKAAGGINTWAKAAGSGTAVKSSLENWIPGGSAAFKPVAAEYKVTLVGSCLGHTGYLKKLDWNIASNAIQTTGTSYELLYFSIPDCRAITGTRQLIDYHWWTQSCPFGWSVQGIWPRFSDGTDINSVGRSNSQRLLATTDDFGAVKVFQHPCVGSGMNKFGRVVVRPSCLEFRGHASHVTNCAWAANDKYLITTGGSDLSIFVWKVTHSFPPASFVDSALYFKLQGEQRVKDAAASPRGAGGATLSRSTTAFMATLDPSSDPLRTGILRGPPAHMLEGIPAACVSCGFEFSAEEQVKCPRCFAPRSATFGPQASIFKPLVKAPTRTGKIPNLGGLGHDEILAKSASAAARSISNATGSRTQSRYSIPTTAFGNSCRAARSQRQHLDEVRRTAPPAVWMPSGLFDPRTARLPVPDDDSDEDDAAIRRLVLSGGSLRSSRPASAGPRPPSAGSASGQRPASAGGSSVSTARLLRSGLMSRSAKLFADVQYKKKKELRENQGRPRTCGPDFSDV